MFNVASNAKWPNSNNTLTFQVANRTEDKARKVKVDLRLEVYDKQRRVRKEEKRKVCSEGVW